MMAASLRPAWRRGRLRDSRLGDPVSPPNAGIPHRTGALPGPLQCVPEFSGLQLLQGTSRYVGWQQYRQLLQDAVFWRSLWNNMVWTIGGVGGQLVVGLIAAVALDVPGRKMAVMRSLLLVPYVVPTIATAITWRWMFNDFYGILSFLLVLVGLLPPNTSPFASVELAMPTAILVSVWRGFPFAMIVFWAAPPSHSPAAI